VEVSEYLVGSPAFKAGGTGDPRPAGSIPVHLRQSRHGRRPASRCTAVGSFPDRGTGAELPISRPGNQVADPET